MIALITPTGGRPKQLGLCAEYMARQDYDGEILWIIVDDCEPITTNLVDSKFKVNWTIKMIYPEPKWKRGQNTQARNLQVGIDVVKQYGDTISAVFIIEDDDYYTNTYLTQMLANLSGFLACGEVQTIYVNIRNFFIRKNKNKKHSSLFQTAFVPELLPIFENVIKTSPRFIDTIFWRQIQQSRINLFTSEKPLSIGLKGIEGRPGIGMGHNYFPVKKEDSLVGMMALKNLIGIDYLNYL
jgi:hypothetical protein